MFSGQFSLEEFELMRPSIDDRHRKVVRDMKMFMETQGRCNNCTKWMMETVESRKKGDVSRLDVGFWTPAGPYLKDDLFPHVKGNFRGRMIPVASVHVRPLSQLYIIVYIVYVIKCKMFLTKHI